MIRAKADGKEPPALETQEEQAGKVVDLIAALVESVSKAQASRGESGKDGTVHDMPKKRAAKKAAAKKTAAKKSSTKKIAGKKTMPKKRGA